MLNQNDIQYYIRISVNCLNFIKIEKMMTTLRRHLRFLKAIVLISNSIELTHFILCNNIQLNKVHLVIKVH